MLWLCPAGQKCVRSYRLPGVFPADNIANSRISGAMFGLFEDIVSPIAGCSGGWRHRAKNDILFASSWIPSRFLWRATLLFCVGQRVYFRAPAGPWDVHLVGYGRARDLHRRLQSFQAWRRRDSFAPRIELGSGLKGDRPEHDLGAYPVSAGYSLTSPRVPDLRIAAQKPTGRHAETLLAHRPSRFDRRPSIIAEGDRRICTRDPMPAWPGLDK